MMHSTYQCIICPMKRQPDRHRDYVTRRIGAVPGVHPAKARRIAANIAKLAELLAAKRAT